MLILIIIRMVPESPRWLIGMGRFDEALKILKGGAKVNKKTLPPDSELLDMMEKVKQAADFCQSIIDVALGGKKASGKVKTFIDKYQSGRTAKTGESEAYQLAATVGSQLNRLYRDYGYYLGAIQKEKEDKTKKPRKSRQLLFESCSNLCPLKFIRKIYQRINVSAQQVPSSAQQVFYHV